LETLDLLQERLAEYAGTVLLVSHDRDFLDRVVTSIIVAEGNGRWVEYAGGYSDMLAQRAGSIVRAPASSSKKSSRSTAVHQPTIARPPRLSFAERHTLDTLPARIEALQEKIAQLNGDLADTNLYMHDPKRFSQTTTALAAAQAEMDAAEEQWLSLELLRERLDGKRPEC